MLEHCVESRDSVRRRRSGILGAHLDSFAEHLAKRGYAAATVRSQLILLGHFNHWLVRRRLGLGDLNDELVDKFVHERKRLGKWWREVVIHQFLTYLRTHGVISSPTPVIDETPLGRQLHQYEQYLILERGLAPATVTNYSGFFRGLLTERFGNEPMDLRELDVPTVTTFVLRHASTMSHGRAKIMGTALRSIFQFLGPFAASSEQTWSQASRSAVHRRTAVLDDRA